MSTSKTGKHGHAKVNFTGLDIFTGKKVQPPFDRAFAFIDTQYKAVQASTHNMWTFESTKSDWSVRLCLISY